MMIVKTRIKTPAVSLPLTLAEAKQQLRIDIEVTHFDDDIMRIIQAVTDYWERETHTSLIVRTIEGSMPGFPDDDETEIEIPLPPLIEVMIVKYIDLGGEEAEWTGFEVDAFPQPATLRPKSTESYPDTSDRYKAVTIEYTAGHGASAADIPAEIKQGLLLLVTHWFEHRLPVERGADVSPYAFALDSILRRHRVIYM